VVAIIIMIVMLEMDGLHASIGAAPVLLAYVSSFVNVGLLWNGHHHRRRARRWARAVGDPVSAVLAELGAVRQSLVRDRALRGSGCAVAHPRPTDRARVRG
jgi:hypothetical protein